LEGAYFMGNAPTADDSIFTFSNKLTVYCRKGTTGWEKPFAGWQAVLASTARTSRGGTAAVRSLPPRRFEPEPVPSTEADAAEAVAQVDKLMQAMIAAYGQMTAVMKTIKDAPTAQAAKPRLMKIVAEMNGRSINAQGLFEGLSAHARGRLDSKYKYVFMTAIGSFGVEQERLMDLNIPEVTKVMLEVTGSMQGAE
jgi:hypothetical protein